MGRRMVSGTRAARAVRGLWPDRNLVRRRVDRVEAAIVGALLAAFLAGAPFAAIAAGHAGYRWAARAAGSQRSWHQVSAVLLTSVPASWGSRYETTGRVGWTGPGGSWHTGTAPVPWGARAGSTVVVWVDAPGHLANPPLRPAQVPGQAALAAVLGAAALGLLLMSAGLIAHTVLRRWRMAAWDLDWQATEPHWTGRR